MTTATAGPEAAAEYRWQMLLEAPRSTRQAATPCISSSLHVEKHSDTLGEEVLCTVVDILGEEDGVARLESDRAANGLQQRLLRWRR